MKFLFYLFVVSILSTKVVAQEATDSRSIYATDITTYGVLWSLSFLAYYGILKEKSGFKLIKPAALFSTFTIIIKKNRNGYNY